MQIEKLQRDTGSCFRVLRFHTYEKEVNKCIWEGVWGSWTQGKVLPGPELKGLTQTPQQDGQAQQEVKEEEEVFVH